MPDYILTLPSELSIGELDGLRSQMLEALSTVEQVTVAAEGVERIDTAGLQLMVAFGQEAEVQHKAVIWKGCSNSFLRTASLLGAEHLFISSSEPNDNSN